MKKSWEKGCNLKKCEKKVEHKEKSSNFVG